MVRTIVGILVFVTSLSLAAPYGALCATVGVILAGSAWGAGRRVTL